MLFIFALLALLSLSVTGLPTNTTDLIVGNTTKSDVSGNPNPLCFWGGSIQDQMPGECRCWGGATYSGPGTDRSWIVYEIDRACDIWTGGVGDPVAEYGLAAGLNQGFTSAYYKVIPGMSPIDIRVTLHIWQQDHCLGPFPVSRDYCRLSFRAPLDACNTGGVGNKHGGYQKTECMTWIVDSNPSDHWPYNSAFIDG